MIDLFEQSMFYCEHISELNESDFKSFKVKHALPIDKLIRRYQEAYGFVRLDLEDELALNKRYKPSDNESCIFMYQRVRSYIV